MEGTAVEKDCSPLWNLFQQIIMDMKNGTPMWEDFISKATKLHSALKSALGAVAAYLDAFQKIADAATNARGATKDIGTALTRVCLRHRAIETRMKTFISTLQESLIMPLGTAADEWRRATAGGWGREHARDCKRARAELRRRALDAARAGKKARRPGGTTGDGDVQRRTEDVNERRQQLEEMEEKAVKAALIEERSRFCHFVSLLNPVMESEVAILAEVGHLQEGAGQLLRHTNEPRTLPAASLQVISDLKASSGGSVAWECASPTPHSPTPSSRLGSRKSSLCSISSLASSSSGSQAPAPLTPTPGSEQSQHQRSPSQAPRLGSVSSRDSGFTSQDTLHLPPLPEGFIRKSSDNHSLGSTCTTPAKSNLLDDNDIADGNKATDGLASATWPDLKDTAQFERAATAIMGGRPHTISAAYEKCHPRPALTVHTFASSVSQPASPCCGPVGTPTPRSPARDSSGTAIYGTARPPLPTRCSSLERPSLPAKCHPVAQSQEFKTAKPSSLPPHLTKEMSQATYVNMSELANMAASRVQQQQQLNNADCQQQTSAQQQEKVCEESSASESSLESSSGYGSQGAFVVDDASQALHAHVNQQDVEIAEIDTLRCERGSIMAARENFSLSLGSLEEAVRSLDEVCDTPTSYATIKKTKPSIPKRRPLSMTASCSSAAGRLTMPRRGSSTSVSGAKPPPPVRRSSSISRPHHHASHYQVGSGQLPYSGQQQMSPGSQSVQSSTCEDLPPPPAFLLNPSDEPRCSTPQGINVAETVKALTELRHTPASPGLMRRSLQNQINSNQPQLQTAAPTTSQSQNILSTFQQAKASGQQVNPIYGQTGHRIMTYIEQTNSIYGQRSRKNSLNTSNSDLFRDTFNNSNQNLYGESQQHRSSPHESSPGTPIYNEGSFSSFGPRIRDSLGETSHYGQTGFKLGNQEKKHTFVQSNTIYAQPSQIIAGFNNIGLGHRGSESLSPLALRKNIAARSQSADRRGSEHGTGASGLIAALSAKLVPQLSPRNSRRAISSITPGDGSVSHDSNLQSQTKGKVPLAGNVQPAFLDKLSATIQQQRRSLDAGHRATTVRQTINAQAQPDPRVCHGSLMEQIKRGATLKRNKQCNDRSAPKIR